ncbi:hypothetical protein [Gilvibacter sediminis]|uniref:hypothetical protein n=1 Tax=Gilvibacter sediminis TaxID=379071 RepID=UPI00235081FE|nr:hypothetical protein [Gilvibacter sediminis]MDC7999141.1 hypothetical protein [Gilvibacter sediminis]
MKTIKSSLFALLAVVALTTVSCSEDDNNNNNNNAAANLLAEELRNTASSGTWRVSRYEDNGQNETSDYNGYSFTFGSDGMLTATNSSNTVTGTWSVTVDSSSSDSSDDDGSDDSDDVDFNIFFASPADFEELSDDWDIVSRTDTRIELIDISGGDGSIEYLTFEKN